MRVRFLGFPSFRRWRVTPHSVIAVVFRHGKIRCFVRSARNSTVITRTRCRSTDKTAYHTFATAVSWVHLSDIPL